MLHADEMATVWVIRGGARDRMVQPFLDDGAIGLAYPELPDGRTLDRAAALRLLGGVPDAEGHAARFLSFVRRISVGDLVLMPDHAARGFPVGVVAGDYEYHDDLSPERCRHRRPVEWRRRLPFAELPERLKHLPNQRHDIDDVADGRLRDLALRCSREELGEDPFDRPRGAPPPSRAPRSPRASRPTRPPKATIAERRCASCLLVKPADVFEDGSDWCRDCQ